MPADKIDVAIVPATGFFNIAPASFIVSQPTGDGGVQIVFCDDFVAVNKMSVMTSGEAKEVSVGTALSFDTEPERVAYGRVKLSLAGSKALVKLLQSHVEQLEKALSESESPTE